MLIELENAFYETYLEYAQIEITGMCNMHCRHCRAVKEPHRHLTLEEVQKILLFINKNKGDNFRVTLSGGEPFLHPQIVEILGMLKKSNIENVLITSNGSCITKEILEKIEKIGIKKMCIQISLDSVNKETHDKFRGFEGAYDKALKALKLIKTFIGLMASIRATLTHSTLKEVGEIVDLSRKLGVDRVGIGTVIPVGNGSDGTLTLSKQEKKQFLTTLAEKHWQYKGMMDVTTEDPTKCLVDNSPWIFKSENVSSYDCEFGGCTAGVSSFNVSADGTVVPCSVLWLPIMNIFDYDNVEDMTKTYSNSIIIKNLVSRKFKGKCSNCEFKYSCGGCRATAMGLTGDYMAEDPTCWKLEK